MGTGGLESTTQRISIYSHVSGTIEFRASLRAALNNRQQGPTAIVAQDSDQT